MQKQSIITPKRLFDLRVTWADFRPDEFQYIPCLLCGTFDYVVLTSIVINWAEFYIVQCPHCRVIWRNPIPDSSFLNNLYSEHYYNVKEHSPDLIYQVGIADSHGADQDMRRRKSREEVQRWVQRGIAPTDGNETMRLLEIGGGRGYLQQAAAKEGWNTTGIEISPHGIKEAISKGLIVLPIPLEELAEKYVPYNRYFDLAVFFDFLEHVSDPARVLRMIRHLLKEEGVIILRTPVTEQCPTLHLIDHIWHFSESTLQILLEREGFNIFEKHESGIFRSPDGNFINNLTVYARKT